MLINGMRFPAQSNDASLYDPSIIPALAVERVDALLDGASATYGSDAVAGVVNVILRRNFDGAISQVRVSKEPDGRGLGWQASQLWGRTWDGGGVTLTGEFYRTAEIQMQNRSFFTHDFRPWGLDDTSPLRSSIPGVVSTGAPSATVGTGCTNCYSVPRGQNGIGLTWDALLANKGVDNLYSPYQDASLVPAQTRTAFVATLDQQLIPGVSLFVDAFWSNRRIKNYMITSASVGQTSSFIVPVPTSNPYYPIGAPAGLRVAYNLSSEMHPYYSAVSRGQRFATGLNLELPRDWGGRLSWQISDNLDLANAEDLPNPNHIAAALGNTVAATGSVASYTKPAGVPYLNLFCDPTAFACNDPATLDYVRGYRRDSAHFIINEWNATFDGPLFSLPGGDVLAAVGGGYVDNSFAYLRTVAHTSPSIQTPGLQVEHPSRNIVIGYAQINVPIFGEANAIPLFRELTLEVGFRVDNYSDFGYTRNPKFSVNWSPVDDLTFRGSWGTSFRAPTFEDSFRSLPAVRPVNAPTGRNNSTPACVTVGGTPVPGSAAEILNPTCSAALQYQGGVNISGSLPFVVRSGIRPADYALGPEKATTISAGFDYAPTSFLSGLQLSATYFHVKIRGAIGSNSADLNNPADRANILLSTDPGFAEALAAAAAASTSEIPPTLSLSTIKFLQDAAPANLGAITADGIDFSVSYDRDAGNWGIFRASLNGTYYLNRKVDDGHGGVTDQYVGFGNNAGLGNSTDARLKWRGQIGWMRGPWNANVFINYYGHFFDDTARPPSPPAPADYLKLVPAQYTFDLSVGYDTGETPAKDYLRNIGVQVVVKNLADRSPPFAYHIDQQIGNAAFPATQSFSPVGREISLTLTKQW